MTKPDLAHKVSGVGRHRATCSVGPWLRLPARAEFEGQILRQWDVTAGDDDAPDKCCVAIDDGTSDQAWALTVIGKDPASLTPGTLVRVTVNPRLNKVISIQPFRPPVGAARLLDTTPDPRTGAPVPGLG